ncbi:MAG: methyltransferase domain-containing protein [Desulfobacterales bacterium]|nr:methyltransferase domain-containing protein [Desulfobacterales bacterium]MDD4072384.1 methyltransferase domain-containing protein [Desulfobacterales bacterium]MDD4392345.1 methyltransferase domain-containing protein [Desulfobacterales bacterium]
MVTSSNYIMESEEESLRLDWKTDTAQVCQQALWAGIKPGMRVADIGCGPGKTTSCLNELVQPDGSAVGIDFSGQRILYAENHNQARGLTFIQKDFLAPLDELGAVDFIWIRFVLEYHRSRSYEIIKNITKILEPGGILCMIDLDLNCLCHYGMPRRLELAVFNIMDTLEKHADFDPYAGRKLYSFCYDLGYEDIDVSVASHHLFYGGINASDMYNWTQKVKIAAKESGYDFKEYGGDYHCFYREFQDFFSNPKRFTYTPLIACRGRKPSL